jgi:drug/metabolite transporter (DMT)-like permease
VFLSERVAPVALAGVALVLAAAVLASLQER